MGWVLFQLVAALMWFGMFVGVAFFDYEPSRFVIGIGFFLVGLASLHDAARSVLDAAERAGQ